MGVDDFLVEGGGVEGGRDGAVGGVMEAEVVKGDGGEVVADELGKVREGGGGKVGGGEVDVGEVGEEFGGCVEGLGVGALHAAG